MTNKSPATDEAVASAKRDQVNVNLLGLSERLREHAARKRITFAAALRSAIVQMLDAEPVEAESGTHDDVADDPKVVRVLLRLSTVHASELVARARASGMSRSQYVVAMMGGAAPPALPADHTSMIAALMASSDRLAAMSVDLNAFMRLLRAGGKGAELEAYRAGVMSLVVDVRAHLRTAAAVLAELNATRRWR